MMCCTPSPIPPNANPQLIKLTSLIKLLSLLQLCLGIMDLFVSIFSGLMIIIGAFILYAIICQRNWCTPIFYVVITLMDWTTSMMLVGDYFTKHNSIESGYGFPLFITLIKFPFYTLTIYYAFLAYKELKALFMEIAFGSVPDFAQQAPNPSQNASRPHTEPFTGPGYRIN
jgi:hypothetical protein